MQPLQQLHSFNIPEKFIPNIIYTAIWNPLYYSTVQSELKELEAA